MDEAAAALLLAGFRAHDVASYDAFVALLIPALSAAFRKRWSSLKHARGDMLELALSNVVEWRASGLLPANESFAELVERLVRASAQTVRRRDERDDRLRSVVEPDAPPTDQRQSLLTEELRQRVWDLQAKLDPKHQRVLEAYAQSELEDRTIAEILGVSPEAAWKMAQRARAALYAAIKEAKLTAADFFDGHPGDNDA